MDASMPGRSGLRRRSLVAGAAAAGALPLAGCSTPLAAGLLGSQLSPDTVVYWNLFGGGDGGRMQDMVAVYAEEHGPESIEATTFAWGNPYYSKVTLATVGDQPPDVAISHLTRALPLWDGGILEPFTDEDLAGVGLSPEDFNEAAWEAQQVDGQNVAIPLDTHPFVLFFNREVCEQADLVESDGRLVNLDGLDTFESALEELSGVTGGNAITLANVGEMSTPWRFFSTMYNQFDDATPFLSDGGAELTVNEDLFIEVMSMVQKWAENGWLNTGLDYAGSQTEMFRGNAGMYMQGEWEISTAQTIEGLDFGMQPIPTLFDKPAAQADSHTFVLPRKERTPEQRQQAMTFIKSMLDQSLDWAEGGHVPTYLPAFESEEYRQMEPQHDYASAAEVAAYNDPAWYGGSGSTFEATVGAQLALVQQLAISPQAALSAIRAQLETYLSTPSPL